MWWPPSVPFWDLEGRRSTKLSTNLWAPAGRWPATKLSTSSAVFSSRGCSACKLHRDPKHRQSGSGWIYSSFCHILQLLYNKASVLLSLTSFIQQARRSVVFFLSYSLIISQYKQHHLTSASKTVQRNFFLRLTICSNRLSCTVCLFPSTTMWNLK